MKSLTKGFFIGNLCHLVKDIKKRKEIRHADGSIWSWTVDRAGNIFQIPN